MMITELVGSSLTMYDYEPAAETMLHEVLRGLRADPKRLPSQYLYDRRGAELFEKICETQEYYPTRTEIGILNEHSAAIAERVGPQALIIEPGSGSGIKTNILLDSLEDPAGYVPIDVAKEQLVEFALRMDEAFSQLEVLPVCADFTGTYQIPPCEPAQKRVAYFPGSTIGNFMPDAAIALLKRLAELCGADGGILVGVDLKKDAAIIEPAYDDAQGLSREFALNYLRRLNEELGANFQVRNYCYEAPFNKVHGRIEMSLISLCRQTVNVNGSQVHFAEDERIGTEYSYKYTLDEFAAIASLAGLRIEDVWTDSNELFSIQHLLPG